MNGRSLNPQTMLIAGAVIVGGYVLLQAFGFLKKTADTVGKAAAAAGQAIEGAYLSARDATASGFYALFGPEDKSGPSTFYTVTFPDGQRHAIGADRVDANGFFIWRGYPDGTQAAQRLRIVKDISNTKFAVLP